MIVMNDDRLYKITYRFLPEFKEMVITALSDGGIDEFEEGNFDVYLDPEYQGAERQYEQVSSDDCISCYLKTEAEAESVTNAVLAFLKRAQIDAGLSSQVLTLKNEDWRDVWKENFKPLQVTQHILIIPNWMREQALESPISIFLDPGMAFGTGGHETTQVCLKLIEKIALEEKITSFLDVGTGSGILSIAAKKLKIPNIIAIDIDADAIKVAQQNALDNQCTIQFQHTLIEEMDSQFDLVCANIISSVLKMHWQSICRAVKPGGFLIISGILKEEALWFTKRDSVQLKFQQPEGEWVGLVLKKSR